MPITNRNLQPGMVLTAKYKGLHYAAVVLADGKSLEMPARHDRVGFAKPRTFTSLSKAAMAITENSVNGWRFWTIDGPEALSLEAANDPAVEAAHAMANSLPSGAEAAANELYGSIPSGAITDQDADDEAPPEPQEPDTDPWTGEDTTRLVEDDELTIHHGATLDATDDEAQEPYQEQGGGGNTGLGKYTRTVTPKPRPARQRAYNPIKRLPNQKAVPEGSTRYWCDGCAASFIAEELALDPKDDGYACPAGHTVASMRQAALGGSFEDLA